MNIKLILLAKSKEHQDISHLQILQNKYLSWLKRIKLCTHFYSEHKWSWCTLTLKGNPDFQEPFLGIQVNLSWFRVKPVSSPLVPPDSDGHFFPLRGRMLCWVPAKPALLLLYHSIYKPKLLTSRVKIPQFHPLSLSLLKENNFSLLCYLFHFKMP